MVDAISAFRNIQSELGQKEDVSEIRGVVEGAIPESPTELDAQEAIIKLQLAQLIMLGENKALSEAFKQAEGIVKLRGLTGPEQVKASLQAIRDEMRVQVRLARDRIEVGTGKTTDLIPPPPIEEAAAAPPATPSSPAGGNVRFRRFDPQTGFSQ